MIFRLIQCSMFSIIKLYNTMVNIHGISIIFTYDFKLYHLRVVFY